MARRLRTIADVRRYLSTLINRLEENAGDELDPAVAGRLAYISNILLGAIKDADIEQRVRVLEEKLLNRDKTMASALESRLHKIEIMSNSKNRLHVVVVPTYPADASETEKKTVVDAAIRDYEQSRGKIGENDVTVIVIDRFTGESSDGTS